MLPTYYNALAFAGVTDLGDFYKTKLPEMDKVKALMNNAKLLFNLPQNKILLQVSQEERIYKYILLSPDVHEFVLGFFVYIPQERRLDLYDGSDGGVLPIIQWKGKKAVWKNYSTLLDMVSFPQLFSRLVNVI